MEWQTPKTNWKATDSFNISDFNRIKNNLEIIIGYMSSAYEAIDEADMGDDISSYAGYWNVDHFNAIEQNIETVSQFIQGVTPMKQTFYNNGLFISYTELNRIESIIAKMADDVQGWLDGLMRLPFTVGRDRRLPF